MRVTLIPRDHDLRPAAEQLIAEVYALHYAARITTFPDTLVAMIGDDGAHPAPPACALPPTVSSRKSIWTRRSMPCCRRCATPRSAARRSSRSPRWRAARRTWSGLFLRKIIACGEAAGFEWAFFTATAPLKALLERMGLPLVPLADGDRSRVANPDDWGSYYALAPQRLRRPPRRHRLAPSSASAASQAGPRPMVEILRVLQGWIKRSRDGDAAMSDDNSVLTRGELAARVAGLAEEFRDLPRVIGLLGANGTDWAVAQLAAWSAGKTVVPLPTFFSRLQLEHVLRDAGVDHVVATSDAVGLAAALGVGITPVSNRRAGQMLRAHPRRRCHRLHVRQHRPAKGRPPRP